jgi:hypothetical protein
MTFFDPSLARLDGAFTGLDPEATRKNRLCFSIRIFLTQQPFDGGMRPFPVTTHSREALFAKFFAIADNDIPASRSSLTQVFSNLVSATGAARGGLLKFGLP